ncbi:MULTISPECIES: hypothetical protein [unclassified Sedimentibacter]|uniref:hypothetical protein n=1 Tax=unclassified Sedimentibacter TaxID=2649220 RepID=UPI0027DF206C|nr:hypothetical protein [Sedimentibacter sp. MB35-C1]WMJ78481.1 hypothetical protein RBQ61_06050 [Sedimentibacter sp. MB35-C1]
MKYSGITDKTADNLLLDAGAFFKNFIVGTDTFESAVTANKLIGATQGGGSFSAIPTIRKIDVDGTMGVRKGLQHIDEWVVTISANVKEISQDTIKIALGSGDVVDGPNNYKKITANHQIRLTDYIDNITWVGKLSGSEMPVIIVVKNALATSGLTLNVADKAEAVIAMTFTGHFTNNDPLVPPFEIYYPNKEVTGEE